MADNKLVLVANNLRILNIVGTPYVRAAIGHVTMNDRTNDVLRIIFKDHRLFKHTVIYPKTWLSVWFYEHVLSSGNVEVINHVGAELRLRHPDFSSTYARIYDFFKIYAASVNSVAVLEALLKHNTGSIIIQSLDFIRNATAAELLHRYAHKVVIDIDETSSSRNVSLCPMMTWETLKFLPMLTDFVISARLGAHVTNFMYILGLPVAAEHTNTETYYIRTGGSTILFRGIDIYAFAIPKLYDFDSFLNTRIGMSILPVVPNILPLHHICGVEHFEQYSALCVIRSLRRLDDRVLASVIAFYLAANHI